MIFPWKFSLSVAALFGRHWTLKHVPGRTLVAIAFAVTDVKVSPIDVPPDPEQNCTRIDRLALPPPGSTLFGHPVLVKKLHTMLLLLDPPVYRTVDPVCQL